MIGGMPKAPRGSDPHRSPTASAAGEVPSTSPNSPAAASVSGLDEVSRGIIEALQRDGNTWKLVHREAAGNRRSVTVEKGALRIDAQAAVAA